MAASARRRPQVRRSWRKGQLFFLGLINKKTLPCVEEGSSKAKGDNPDRKQPA
jgi:hypothetical protein